MGSSAGSHLRQVCHCFFSFLLFPFKLT
jgi:hypothetical protein